MDDRVGRGMIHVAKHPVSGEPLCSGEGRDPDTPGRFPLTGSPALNSASISAGAPRVLMSRAPGRVFSDKWGWSRGLVGPQGAAPAPPSGKAHVGLKKLNLQMRTRCIRADSARFPDSGEK